MRELRTSGSEGGGAGITGPSYPYLPAALRADLYRAPLEARALYFSNDDP